MKRQELIVTKIQDPTEFIKQAAQAYLYGYSLVYNLKENSKFTSRPNLVSQAALS